jgi:hypothetical protein
MEWREIGGVLSLAVGAVTWFDQGKPWAVFSVEDIVYNVEVSETLRASGVKQVDNLEDETPTR